MERLTERVRIRGIVEEKPPMLAFSKLLMRHTTGTPVCIIHASQLCRAIVPSYLPFSMQDKGAASHNLQSLLSEL